MGGAGASSDRPPEAGWADSQAPGAWSAAWRWTRMQGRSERSGRGAPPVRGPASGAPRADRGAQSALEGAIRRGDDGRRQTIVGSDRMIRRARKSVRKLRGREPLDAAPLPRRAPAAPGVREPARRGAGERARATARAGGRTSTAGDLEACYAQAWQGLYTAIAAGEEIANPGGWLTRGDVPPGDRRAPRLRAARAEGERIADRG